MAAVVFATLLWSFPAIFLTKKPIYIQHIIRMPDCKLTPHSCFVDCDQHVLQLCIRHVASHPFLGSCAMMFCWPGRFPGCTVLCLYLLSTVFSSVLWHAELIYGKELKKKKKKKIFWLFLQVGRASCWRQAFWLFSCVRYGLCPRSPAAVLPPSSASGPLDGSLFASCWELWVQHTHTQTQKGFLQV